MNTPKLCVLGSSYIGAVYSAYKLGAPGDDRYDIDFYGHSNGGFPNVDVAGGHIRNVRFKSGPSLDVGSYDAFILYADLPSPQVLHKAMATALNAGCSRQVVMRVATDMVTGSNAYRLAEVLKTLTGKTAILVSANVVSTTTIKMDDARFEEVRAVIGQALGNHDYVAFPRVLFDDLHRPVGDFYRGSVLLTGEKAVENAGHDYHHMNEKGGREVLNAVLRHLDLKFDMQSKAA
jgi:hypothetical protein